MSNYWKQFYKTKHTDTPSSFAKWVSNMIPKSDIIIELGCGNGRDTYYFGKLGYSIIGIDEAIQPKNKYNVKFIQSNIKKLFFKKCKYDVVYSRFFIHSIDDDMINNILRWTKKYFIAEFRAAEDKPILYPEHYRNLIDGNEFIKKMITNKFDIIYYIKSNNLAQYKSENPIIIRMIGKKQ